jgi:hypothetical protein
MFFIWLVMGIGFLASIIHLGSPLRAFNSLNRVGASALSNEIASGALFFAGGFLVAADDSRQNAEMPRQSLASAHHAARLPVRPGDDPGLSN